MQPEDGWSMLFSSSTLHFHAATNIHTWKLPTATTKVFLFLFSSTDEQLEMKFVQMHPCDGSQVVPICSGIQTLAQSK